MDLQHSVYSHPRLSTRSGWPSRSRDRQAFNRAAGQSGVSPDWHGREEIRRNLRAFIDTGFTALHHVVEYGDGGSLKVFRGTVTMTPDDKTKPVVRPVMTHFFYMDEKDPGKVRHWFGAVGPVQV